MVAVLLMVVSSAALLATVVVQTRLFNRMEASMSKAERNLGFSASMFHTSKIELQAARLRFEAAAKKIDEKENTENDPLNSAIIKLVASAKRMERTCDLVEEKAEEEAEDRKRMSDGMENMLGFDPMRDVTV